jgi:transcriptional regulator with XRE-family HTH domain
MHRDDTFARWLDLTMENRNISGNKLAEMMHVHVSQVSRWRHGKGMPSLKTMYRMGRALEVDPIRLAVTAGLLTPEETGKKPLQMPVPRMRVDRFAKQLSKITGLHEAERKMLIDYYRSMQEDFRS